MVGLFMRFMSAGRLVFRDEGGRRLAWRAQTWAPGASSLDAGEKSEFMKRILGRPKKPCYSLWLCWSLPTNSVDGGGGGGQVLRNLSQGLRSWIGRKIDLAGLKKSLPDLKNLCHNRRLRW